MRNCLIGQLIFVLGLVMAAAGSICAQGTTRYVYDDNGRLRAVIAPNGEANIYEYDAAGNFTTIRRNAGATLEVLDFSPREGGPGTQVTIIGTGFGAGVNTVVFNGTVAQIVSVNAPVVTTTVPNGATTGPISVTTPGGTATTAQLFTVRGISVTPTSTIVASGQTVQFSAAVLLAGDQSIVWKVDGLEGGSSSVGTITSAGRYTAPALLPSQPSVTFRIRAASAVNAQVFGEALVTVKNPEFIRPVFTQSLTVRNGVPPNNTPLYGPAISVRNGVPPNPTPLYSTALSIQNGIPPNPTPIYNAAVSVTFGPSISAISPGQVRQGLTTNITMSGANLSGTTALSFIDITSSLIDTNITVSNINVNGAGTSLTAALTISGNAALGRRIVFVTASGNTSPMADAGANIVEVIP